jgi:hypothetical protein
MMATTKCAVLIPVYRQNPLECEIISLKQCCKKLNDYPIIIITYKALNINGYIKILEEYSINYRIEYFEQTFFAGISGYNSLMFSDKFYKRFLFFEYIFIYQLDAYIFTSNLDYWIEQGYDYIGGPWFQEIKHTQELKWPGWFCGGLCLRRTEYFYSASSTKLITLNKNYYYLIQKIRLNKSLYDKVHHGFVLRIINFIAKLSSIEFTNEDVIWSNIVKQKGKAPSFNTALNFAFVDNFAEHAFALNNNKLPFACHGWDLYHAYKFWEKYIKK